MTMTDTAAADRAALRDRIARAIEDAPYRPETRRSLQLADAVLAVLPAPTDRAAVAVVQRALSVLRNWRDEHEIGPEAARLLYEVGAALTDDSPELRRMADEAQPDTGQPADVEHCVHDRAVHTRHHHQPVTGCPWCAAREQP
jgi:hypothetical protein